MNSKNIVLLVSITTVSLTHVYSTLHVITQPTSACMLPHLQGADTTDHLMICDHHYQYNPVDKTWYVVSPVWFHKRMSYIIHLPFRK